MTLTKRLFILLMVVVCCFSAVFPSAHSAYCLVITIDPIGLTYSGVVSSEGKDANHKEFGWLHFSELGKYAWKNNKDAYKSALNATTNRKSTLKNFYTNNLGLGSCFNGEGWGNPDALPFTFPAYHAEWNDGAASGEDSDRPGGNISLSIDRKRANRINDTVVNGLNSCLSFIIQNCYTDAPSVTEFEMLGVELAIRSEQLFWTGSADSLKPAGTDVLVTFGPATESGGNDWGLPLKNYIKVTIAGESREFCYNCPKGYVPSPYAHGWERKPTISSGDYYDQLFTIEETGGGYDKGEDYIAFLRDQGDAAWIDWTLVVLQGNYHFDVSGVTVEDLADFEDPSWFVKLIGEFFQWAIESITNALALKKFENFMLIKGEVETDWIYGMFPKKWLRPALLLYVASLAIAISLIGFSVLKILWKRQLSTINVGEKIAMQEDLKSLIVTLFLFFAFIPIFIFLAGLNVTIVDLFESTISSTSFTGLIHVSYTNFGSIALAIAELILKIYFNVFYIVRGVTITALIGIAPLAIYSISLGGKFAGVFTAYFKELISQIFLQSVHAMMAAFFFNTLSFDALTIFQKIVLLYAFLPITKFVKTKIFQLSEGPASQVGMTGVKTATGLASGAIKGATSFNPGRSGGKGDGERGRGGAEKSDGVLSSAIDRNATTERKKDGHLDMKDSLGHENWNTKEGSSGAFRKDTPTPNYIRDADRISGGKFVKGMGGAALTAAKSGLYAGSAIANAGMGLGMGMLGEDPSKYMEQAGANLGKAAHTQGLAVKQTYDASSNLLKYSLAKDGGRHQYIREAEDAGIIGIRQTGGAMTYGINYRNANDHHKSVYEDIKKAYTADSDGKFTKQQEAAQKHYRDNYGITQVRMDSVNGKKMQIDLDSAAMEAHRMSDTNPFAGMKTFNWREEKDS